MKYGEFRENGTQYVINTPQTPARWFNYLFNDSCYVEVSHTDYVHQFKIAIAKKMLEKHNETIENVAYILGYTDRAYFSRVFKKYTGMNPGDYRNKNSNHVK